MHNEDEDVSPRTVTPPRKKKLQSPVSPLENNPSTWHKTVVPSIDPSSVSEARNDSNATLFPSFTVDIRKSETTGNDTRNLADFFRTAKDIYDVGPKGEGQKLWSSYKQARKGKLELTEIGQRDIEAVLAHRRPSAPGLSAHPPNRPPPSEIRLAARKAVPVTDTLNSRKESDASTSLIEVPIHFDRAVQHFVDRSKPLPSIPQLQAAPNTRKQGYTNLSKPLPAPPSSRLYPDCDTSKPYTQALPPQSVPRYRSQQCNKFPKTCLSTDHVSTAGGKIKYSTHVRGNAQPADVHSSHAKNKNKASHWWKALAEKTSEDYVPASRNKAKASTDKLKAAISRPRPFTALQNGLTANVAEECGGVGGPDAAHARLTEGRKGKSKANFIHSPVGMHFPTVWRDKLTSASDSAGKIEAKQSKKRDSDMSFACAGVEEDYAACIQDPGPSRQMIEDQDMRPEPLFSGTRGGEDRDTKFYGPYHDVLNEYRR
jgi:hypothetical protein